MVVMRGVTHRLFVGSFTATAGALLLGSTPSTMAAQSNELISGQALEPSFAAQFAPYMIPPARVEIAPGAVDLNTFEAPREKRPEPVANTTVRTLGNGVASYYGRRFHGRRTANGERFNMRAMTAAHKTLPFGTKVKVTNARNGRSVIVRINDRGPFIRGRTIDLSRGAAEQIGMIASGHARVKMEVVR